MLFANGALLKCEIRRDTATTDCPHKMAAAIAADKMASLSPCVGDQHAVAISLILIYCNRYLVMRRKTYILYGVVMPPFGAVFL